MATLWRSPLLTPARACPGLPTPVRTCTDLYGPVRPCSSLLTPTKVLPKNLVASGSMPTLATPCYPHNGNIKKSGSKSLSVTPCYRVLHPVTPPLPPGSVATLLPLGGGGGVYYGNIVAIPPVTPCYTPPLRYTLLQAVTPCYTLLPPQGCYQEIW